MSQARYIVPYAKEFVLQDIAEMSCYTTNELGQFGFTVVLNNQNFVIEELP